LEESNVDLNELIDDEEAQLDILNPQLSDETDTLN
jgi:hypothetical protein